MPKIEIAWVWPAATLLCTMVGAVYDVRSRRIPNFVTLPAFLAGLVLHSILGGWRQLASAAAGGLICGLVFFVFYLAGGMGGGDVKLIAAAGSLAGLPLIAYLLVWTALAGGVMAIGLALTRRRMLATLRNVRAIVGHHRAMGLTPHEEFNISNDHTLRLPYAVAIMAGSGLTLCRVLLER